MATARDVQEPVGRGNRGAGRRLPTVLRELRLLPVIAITMVIGTVITPRFLTAGNLINNVLMVSAVLGMVVIAESIILISGYFDLSLESTVGLAPMVAAWLVMPSNLGGSGLELPPVLALTVMFLISGVIGIVNGFLIARMRLNAFIVTLAMLILLQGMLVGISGGKTLSGLPTALTFLGEFTFLAIPVQVWIVLAAFVLAGLFMRHHPTGRKIYAMGGNEDAARAAGVRTTRLTIGVFVAGSLIAGLAGLMLTGRIASVTASQGDGMIFTVFAAAVIGGISLKGGRGSLLGAATGVLLLGLIQNLLTLSRVPSYWVNAVYGAIILSALIFGYFASARGAPQRD